MKLAIKSYTYTSLISSILFLILGTILMTTGSLVKIISYILGGVLILLSLIKYFSYRKDKKNQEEFTSDLVYAVFLLVGGIACFFLGDLFATIIRFLIGGWILFIGLNRLINFFNIEKNNNAYAILAVSLLLIIIGLFIILYTPLILKWIGFFMIIYSLLDIAGYLLYTHNEIKNTQTPHN